MNNKKENRMKTKKVAEVSMSAKKRSMLIIGVLAALAGVLSAQATVRTWDGGGDGTTWTDPLNWNPDGTTGTADILTVGPGAVVVNGQNSFASLEIQTNASVTLATNLAGGRTLSVAGTLNKADGVLRLNGAIVNLSGHLASTITFLDTNGGSMSFTDGAAFDNAGMGFEHKGYNTFGFKLSAGGFKTLKAGSLFSGSNGSFSAAWSNVTYNIDISDYDLRSGLRVVLMDFTGHAAVFSSNFNTANVNIITGTSGLLANLAFETATSSLALTFPYPLTWNGDNGSNWMDPLNWTPTNLPSVSDAVLVESGGSVTNGRNTFASLEIQTGASVKLSAATGQGGLGARPLTVSGTLGLDAGGVLRLNGASVALPGHLGSGITWLDMGGGSMHFSDGAAFDNANINFEHKGNNAFIYTLSPGGFTTLVAGRLRSGSSALWANVTYTIDVSAYTGHRPVDIVLADYNGHDSTYSGTFDPTVTVTGHDGGSLSFDTVSSRLVLRVYGPRGTVILVH